MCRGLHAITGTTLEKIVVRNRNLREKINTAHMKHLSGAAILDVSRRGKYILIHTSAGTLIIHLGMSGRLVIVPAGTGPGKHDHVDFILGNGQIVRYNDPRRFGNIQYCAGNPEGHYLLQGMGPEPLEPGFSAAYLQKITSGKKKQIRDLLMDSHLIAGIGNIYAAEILFAAGISPMREAGSLSKPDCQAIVKSTKKILHSAIAAGGTSIRDYVHTDGSKGGYAKQLRVYGREGEICLRCKEGIILREHVHGRSAFYCPVCQKWSRSIGDS